jgi:hypothetical protein
VAGFVVVGFVVVGFVVLGLAPVVVVVAGLVGVADVVAAVVVAPGERVDVSGSVGDVGVGVSDVVGGATDKVVRVPVVGGPSDPVLLPVRPHAGSAAIINAAIGKRIAVLMSLIVLCPLQWHQRTTSPIWRVQRHCWDGQCWSRGNSRRSGHK